MNSLILQNVFISYIPYIINSLLFSYIFNNLNTSGAKNVIVVNYFYAKL